MRIFAKVIGAIEILISIFAAYLAITTTIGFFGGDRFSGEWGGLLIPLDLMVAAVFGWAGYVLLRRDAGAWKHQLIPLIAVAFIAAYVIWADSV